MAAMTSWCRRVPWLSPGRIYRPDTRRAVYPNGYHLLMRDLDRQAVIGDVIAWIRHPDGLLPSGADIAAAAWATRFHPGGGVEF